MNKIPIWKSAFLTSILFFGFSGLLHGQGSPNILWKGTHDADRINRVIFTPDGQTLISGGSDRIIKLWRVSDGALLQTLNTNAPFVHESAIEWLAITPDAKMLASCSYQYIQLWDLPSGTERKLHGHTDWVVSVAFSPNGRTLASASFDTTVRIWDAVEGTLIKTIPGVAQERAVAFSPDGSLLAAASSASIVNIYDTSDWSLITTLTGHSNDLFTCAFSADGTLLSTGGYDQTAKVWRVADWALLHTFDGNGGTVYSTAFTADGSKLIYTDGEGHTIKVYNVSDGTLLRTYTDEVDDVQTVAMSPSGLLGYGRIDSTVVLARLDGASATRITSPFSGSTFNAPATIPITAAPSKTAGSVTKIEFYQNGSKLGEDNTSPFSFSWNNVAIGTYTLTAVETDNLGAVTTSGPVTVTVVDPSQTNQPLAIIITSPQSGATFTANSDIQITANATAEAGVASVEFFQDGISLGLDQTRPFSLRWNSVPVGSYSITAVANDTTGANATSDPITLIVTAAPVESVRPRVVIRSPSSGARFTAPDIVLKGVASDNIGVANVMYSLNGDVFSSAFGIENWEANLILVPGENVVQVKSIDVNGNESAVVSRRFFYTVSHTLSLQVHGLGIVRPLRDGQVLEVGRNYSIKARPARNHVFDGWTGTVETNAANFSFTMVPGMNLIATFVPSPFEGTKGTYYGLIEPETPSHERSGFFQIKTTSSGAFSGKLTLAGKNYPIRGKFDGDGMFSGENLRGLGLNLVLQLHLLDGSEQITGTLSDGFATSILTGDRAVFSRDNPAPQAGQYTVLIPPNPELPNSPRGNGFGILKVDGSGRTRLSGALADGSMFSQSAAVSKNGTLPFYAGVYRGAGSISGELQFREQVEVSDVDGAVNWFRPASGAMFPEGFTSENTLIGSHYTGRSGGPVLNVLDEDENVLINLRDGDLETELQEQATLKSNNRFVIPDSEGSRLRLSISASSGALRGSFIHPITGRPTSHKGVVFQKQNLAEGYFLGTSQSGFVSVIPTGGRSLQSPDSTDAVEEGADIETIPGAISERPDSTETPSPRKTKDRPDE